MGSTWGDAQEHLEASGGHLCASGATVAAEGKHMKTMVGNIWSPKALLEEKCLKFIVFTNDSARD